MTYPVTGPVIGVIGGGQLACMIPRSTNLGPTCRFRGGAHQWRRGSGTYRPRRGLQAIYPRICCGKDVIIFDHEHAHRFSAHPHGRGRKCTTHPEALQYAQDNSLQRTSVWLAEPLAWVSTLDELLASVMRLAGLWF